MPSDAPMKWYSDFPCIPAIPSLGSPQRIPIQISVTRHRGIYANLQHFTVGGLSRTVRSWDGNPVLSEKNLSEQIYVSVNALTSHSATPIALYRKWYLVFPASVIFVRHCDNFYDYWFIKVYIILSGTSLTTGHVVQTLTGLFERCSEHCLLCDVASSSGEEHHIEVWQSLNHSKHTRDTFLGAGRYCAGIDRLEKLCRSMSTISALQLVLW